MQQHPCPHAIESRRTQHQRSTSGEEMRTIIRNGRIVTAVDDYDADILIEDERIATISRKIEAEADRTIDARGRLVIPGGIDPHTHMELPFGGTSASDTFET